MLDECVHIGIREVSVYGFTTDNAKRPPDQSAAFTNACVGFVERARERDVAIRVVGDTTSSMFTSSKTFGPTTKPNSSMKPYVGTPGRT